MSGSESVSYTHLDVYKRQPYRGAMAFEAMRLHVDRSGKQPKAFMLTCGNLAKMCIRYRRSVVGIGPRTVVAIMHYRERLGGFVRAEQLAEVPGVRSFGIAPY